MQALRNCSGTGSPAKIILNHNFYKRCPKAIYLESVGARGLVSIYFDCKSMNMYPAPGGPLQQTTFTIELFNFLDNIVAESRRKDEEASKSAAPAPTPARKR
jgi:hypothetical protein